MGSIFFEITIIISLAAALAVVFKFLKQPAILAYILTGIIIGPFGQLQLQGEESLRVMSEFGITFLLFMLGLELRFSDLRSVGKIALLTGFGQIFFTSLIGYFICLFFGFSVIASLYISIALTFSSTVIIVKLLSDKKDLNSLYGKISVGFLLVQDFFAILVLIVLSGFSKEAGASVSFLNFALALLKGAILFALTVYLSKRLFPYFLDKLARSQEILFLFSIAWVFVLASVVSSPLIGFSIEIGGFLAGLALANSTENYQIVSKIRPLRDFFITIFFVLLGMSMVFRDLALVWLPVVILSFFVLVGNPIIVMTIMGLMGYQRRTSFLAGLTVAQISEFSLIIVFLGYRLNHITSETVSLVTIIGIITFTASTYMILNGNKLYSFLHPFLKVFEKKQAREETGFLKSYQNHIILVGANRTGQSILESLSEMKKKLVVVDFDPQVIEGLKEKNFEVVFGDIADLDIQEKVNLHKANLVVSTVPDFEDNLSLIEGVKRQNKDAKIIVVAYETEDAEDLYKAGADYVVLPHLAGGRYIAKLLKDLSLF